MEHPDAPPAIRLKSENRKLRRLIRELKEHIEELEKERDELKKQRDQFEQQRDQFEQQRDQLKEQSERLKRQIRELEEELEACRRAGYRQAAPFRRKEDHKVEPTKRKRPGRRGGHRGSYRPIPDSVDEQIEVPLEGCPHCHGPVSDLTCRTQYIEEIPQLRPRVSKITTYGGTCPQCGPVESVHPLQSSRAEGAAGVQLGPRALAWAVQLNKAQGLSMRKTCQILDQLAGLKLSPGGLSQALDRIARRIAPLYEQYRADLQQSSAVFVDETSWWVGEPGWWLWVFTTPKTTLYVVEPSRASQVVTNTLGADFSGTLVSDCLASYDPPPYHKHKCLGHHLKAISQARDRPDTRDSSYLDQWTLFFKAVSSTHQLLCDDSSPAEDLIQRLEAWRDHLLAQPPRHTGDLVIRNRLEKQRPHLLGCLYNTDAEPTNNRAERALRPAVIARKISCGNKTPKGKQTWQILATFAATSKQRDLNLVDTLAQLLSLAR